MEVVGHEAVREQTPWRDVRREPQEAQEAEPVGIVVVDRATRNAARRNVERTPVGKVGASGAGHTPRLAPTKRSRIVPRGHVFASHVPGTVPGTWLFEPCL